MSSTFSIEDLPLEKKQITRLLEGSNHTMDSNGTTDSFIKLTSGENDEKP
jgi:hypothetical protein